MTNNQGDMEYQKGIDIIADAESMGDQLKAEPYFLRALELGCDEFNKDWDGWGFLSRYYLHNGNNAKAREAFLRILEFTDATERQFVMGDVLTNLSLIALTDGDYDQAIQYADMALKLEDLHKYNLCEVTYYRAKAFALKAVSLHGRKNKDNNALLIRIDEALSELSKCKPLSVQLSDNAKFEELPGQIDEDIRYLKDLKHIARGGATEPYEITSVTEVDLLRKFRNRVLAHFLLGRILISFDGDEDQAIEYADRALKIEDLHIHDLCEITYYRGKAFAVKAAILNNSQNNDKGALLELIDEALSELNKCKPLSMQLRNNGKFEEILGEINDDITHLSGLKQTLKEKVTKRKTLKEWIKSNIFNQILTWV